MSSWHRFLASVRNQTIINNCKWQRHRPERSAFRIMSTKRRALSSGVKSGPCKPKAISKARSGHKASSVPFSPPEYQYKTTFGRHDYERPRPGYFIATMGEDHADDPVVPAGPGWEMISSSTTPAFILWFWRRRTPPAIVGALRRAYNCKHS